MIELNNTSVFAPFCNVNHDSKLPRYMFATPVRIVLLNLNYCLYMQSVTNKCIDFGAGHTFSKFNTTLKTSLPTTGPTPKQIFVIVL